MRRSAFVWVALLLVVVSVLLVVPGAGKATQPPSRAGIHPLAISVGPANSAGFPTVSFQTGATGRVFFNAIDSSGDTSVLVSVNDGNATRDGLANPVKQWTVPIQGGVNASYLWGVYYPLPLTLAYGGNWNLTVKGTLGGFASAPFAVSTYYVTLVSNQTSYLAAHRGMVLYNVYSTVNNAPYTRATNLALTTQYTTTGAVVKPLPGVPSTLPTKSSGSVSFSVPTDVQPNSFMIFDLFANVSTSNANTSQLGTIGAWAGQMIAPTISFATCNVCPSTTNTFPTGTPVYVLVSAMMSTSTTPIAAPDLTAKFQFISGSTTVTNVPGNPPLTVSTDGSGSASILFLAQSSVFSISASNSVSVTLSDPVNSLATPATTSLSFTVTNATLANAVLRVALDGSQYFSGDTATATWQLGGQNASSANGWTPSQWWAYETPANTLLANGSLPAGTQGSFQLNIPTTYTGSLSVSVTAFNQTMSLSAVANALVNPPAIVLNPSEPTYLPGDSVTISVSTQGSVFSGATLFESVVTNMGYTMSTGPLSGNSIQFNIPTVAVPSSITIAVAAQSPTRGIVGQASLVLGEAGGFSLHVSVQTASNYADGSYQPGQSVTLSYSVVAVGLSVLPKTFELALSPYSSLATGVGATLVQTTSASGQISYTIPSGLGSGSQLFEAAVLFPGCSFCTPPDFFTVNINPSPSVLNYELGAGSGLTVSWLILLVLVIVVAILLLLAVRGRRPPRMEGPKPYVPPTSSTETDGDEPTTSTESRSRQMSEEQPPLPPPVE